MKAEIKDKNIEIVNGKVVIVQQTEQQLDKDELLQSKIVLQRRKQQLVEQSKTIKAQYDACVTQEAEIDNMIIMLDSQTASVEQPIVLSSESSQV
jgi:hypothetical protein